MKGVLDLVFDVPISVRGPGLWAWCQMGVDSGVLGILASPSQAQDICDQLAGLPQ